MTTTHPAGYDPRRGMCEQGQHRRCADADRRCPCACHGATRADREVFLTEPR